MCMLSVRRGRMSSRGSRQGSLFTILIADVRYAAAFPATGSDSLIAASRVAEDRRRRVAGVSAADIIPRASMTYSRVSLAAAADSEWRSSDMRRARSSGCRIVRGSEREVVGIFLE